MAMRAIGAKTDQEFQDEAFTRQHVMDRLAHFAEMLRQHDEGMVNASVSRAELCSFLDAWLGTLVEVDELQCTGEDCSLCRKEAGHA